MAAMPPSRGLRAMETPRAAIRPDTLGLMANEPGPAAHVTALRGRDRPYACASPTFARAAMPGRPWRAGTASAFRLAGHRPDSAITTPPPSEFETHQNRGWAIGDKTHL
jgi:hypothetical protein